METNIFRYVWTHSKRDQLLILAVVLLSLPFYFASLDLPRRIINEAIQGRAFTNATTAQFFPISIGWPSWLGGGAPIQLFEGFTVDRFGLLFGMSALLFGLVVLNGIFKYWINIAKGAVGERMLRRMRFDLFALALRFKPETLGTVKPSEVATIIKDEVEPIGGFIGDAFIFPAFLGLQAATALLFIIIQSFWLGMLAYAVVVLQILIIPRLRRAILKLSRERQIQSRRLSSRVNEVVDGIETVRVHRTEAWERAEIGERLHHLFELRLKIYKRKFLAKFLNNFLSQLTPLLFYVVGGYFALTGKLDIGQLVAVIAAYRELPPPLKELIDWDQQRLDIQVKYDQVVQQFAPEHIAPPRTDTIDDVARLPGPVAAEGVSWFDRQGRPQLVDVTALVPLPGRTALLGDGGGAPSAFAKALAGRLPDHSGKILFGDLPLARLGDMAIGKRIGYASVDPYLFPGTVRDNLIFGLRQRPSEAAAPDAHTARRIAEAKRTGNPVESPNDAWLDYAAAGATDDADLDRILTALLIRLGMRDDLYEFGLALQVDPQRHPELAARLVEARARLRQRLAESDAANLVEFFDMARYARQASISENLLFGVPIERNLAGRNLAVHGGFRKVLAKADLETALLAMGIRIAETMAELFEGLPAGHPLYEQFSFVSAEEMADFAVLLRRRDQLSREERTRFLALTLDYIEPRHRLGLLDAKLEARIVETRPRLHAELGVDGIEPYRSDRVTAAAPLRDNLLFGRVDQSMADAGARMSGVIAEVIDEMGLRAQVEIVGLQHQVGPAGRQLSPQQRTLVNLARNLAKRPDVLVIDGALALLPENQVPPLLDELRGLMSDGALVVTLANADLAKGFDLTLHFTNARLAAAERAPPPPFDPTELSDKVAS